MKEQRKRILHVVYGINGGGVGTVISNYCTGKVSGTIKYDIVAEDIGKQQKLHDTLTEAGFGIFYVTPKGKNLFRNMKEIFRIIKNGNYDGVHVHMEEWSFLYLGMAKLCKVPIRVCHSHMAYMTNASAKPHYKVFRYLLNKWATKRLCCSKDAGDHLYGKREYTVINNAIDVDKYTFNPAIRAKVRKEWNLEDRWVIGNVARFMEQKNPVYTIEVFHEIYKHRKDARLLWIGEGELEEAVRKKIAEYHLEEAVILAGYRRDVPDLLQAMDIFLLPSRYEGLGIVYIEAQAAGLRCFGTEELVPKEACMDEAYMFYLPKTFDAEEWATQILALSEYTRGNIGDSIEKKGYNINTEISKLEKIYF